MITESQVTNSTTGVVTSVERQRAQESVKNNHRTISQDIHSKPDKDRNRDTSLRNIKKTFRYITPPTPKPEDHSKPYLSHSRPGEVNKRSVSIPLSVTNKATLNSSNQIPIESALSTDSMLTSGKRQHEEAAEIINDSRTSLHAYSKTNETSTGETTTSPLGSTVSITAPPFQSWIDVLDEYVGKTNLATVKQALQHYQLIRPDDDISELSDIIDEELAFYRAINLIEVTHHYSVAIEASDPETAQQYKDVIEDLVRVIHQITGNNEESAIRQKRSPETAPLVILLKNSLKKLDAISSGNAEGMKEFFMGFNQRKHQIISKINDPWGGQAELKELLNSRSGILNDSTFKLNSLLSRENYFDAGVISYESSFKGLENIFFDRFSFSPDNFLDYLHGNFKRLIELTRKPSYSGTYLKALINVAITRTNPVLLQDYGIPVLSPGICSAYVTLSMVAESSDLFLSNFVKSTYGLGAESETLIELMTALQILTWLNPQSQNYEQKLLSEKVKLQYLGYKTDSFFLHETIHSVIQTTTGIMIGQKITVDTDKLGEYLVEAITEKQSISQVQGSVSHKMQLALRDHVISLETQMNSEGEITIIMANTGKSYSEIKDTSEVNLVNTFNQLLLPEIKHAKKQALERMEENPGISDIDKAYENANANKVKLEIPTESQLQKLGQLQILPNSCLTISDVVNNDVSLLPQLEQERTTDFLNDYLDFMERPEVIDCLTQEVPKDFQPTAAGVFVNDHVLLQMKEVKSTVENVLAQDITDLKVPVQTVQLHNNLAPVLDVLKPIIKAKKALANPETLDSIADGLRGEPAAAQPVVWQPRLMPISGELSETQILNVGQALSLALGADLEKMVVSAREQLPGQTEPALPADQEISLNQKVEAARPGMIAGGAVAAVASSVAGAGGLTALSMRAGTSIGGTAEESLIAQEATRRLSVRLGQRAALRMANQGSKNAADDAAKTAAEQAAKKSARKEAKAKRQKARKSAKKQTEQELDCAKRKKRSLADECIKGEEGDGAGPKETGPEETGFEEAAEDMGGEGAVAPNEGIETAGLEDAGGELGVELGDELGGGLGEEASLAFRQGLAPEALEFLDEGVVLMEEVALDTAIAGLSIGAIASGVGIVIGGIILVIEEKDLIKYLFTDPDMFAREMNDLLSSFNSVKHKWDEYHRKYHRTESPGAHNSYSFDEIMTISSGLFNDFTSAMLNPKNVPGANLDQLESSNPQTMFTGKKRSGRSVQPDTLSDNTYADVHLIRQDNKKTHKARIHSQQLKQVYKSRKSHILHFVDQRPCDAEIKIAPGPVNANPALTSQTSPADSRIPLAQPVSELLYRLILDVRNHIKAGWLNYLQSLLPANEWLSQPEDREDIVQDYVTGLQFFWSDLKIQSKLSDAGIQCHSDKITRSEFKVVETIFKEQVASVFDHLSAKAVKISDNALINLEFESRQQQNHGDAPSGSQPAGLEQKQQVKAVIAQVIWSLNDYLIQHNIDRSLYMSNAESAVMEAAGIAPDSGKTVPRLSAAERRQASGQNRRLNRLEDRLRQKQQQLQQDLLADLEKLVGCTRQDYRDFLQDIQGPPPGNPVVNVVHVVHVVAGATGEGQAPDDIDPSFYRYDMDGFEAQDIYGVKQAHQDSMQEAFDAVKNSVRQNITTAVEEINRKFDASKRQELVSALPEQSQQLRTVLLDQAEQLLSVFIGSIDQLQAYWSSKVEKRVPSKLPLSQDIPWPDTISQSIIQATLGKLMASQRQTLTANLITYINSLDLESSGMIEGVSIRPWNDFWDNLNDKIATQIAAIQTGPITRPAIGGVLAILRNAVVDACNFYSYQAMELSRTAVKSLQKGYREFVDITAEFETAYAAYQLRQQKTGKSQKKNPHEAKDREAVNHFQQYNRASKRLRWLQEKITDIYLAYATHIGQQVERKQLIRDPVRLENTLALSLGLDLSGKSVSSHQSTLNPAVNDFYENELSIWRSNVRYGFRELIRNLVAYSLNTAYLSFLHGRGHREFGQEGLNPGPADNDRENLYRQLQRQAIAIKHDAEDRVIRARVELARELVSIQDSFLSLGTGSLEDIHEVINHESEVAFQQLHLINAHGIDQVVRDWPKNVLEIYNEEHPNEQPVRSFAEYYRKVASNLPSTETLTTTELTTTRNPPLPKRHHHPRHHKNIPIAPERADYLQPGRQRRSMAESIDQDTGNLPAETDPGDITSGASGNHKGLLFDATDLSLGLLSRLSDMFSDKPSHEPFQASRVVDQKTGGSDANGAFGANSTHSTHDTGGPSGTDDTGGTGVERHVFQVQAYYNGHCQDQPSCEPTQSMVAMRGNTREACAVMGKPGEIQCMIFSNQPANHAEQSNPDNPGHLPSTKKASLLDALEGNARVAWQQDTGVLQNDLHDLRFPGTTNEPLPALVKRAAELGPLPAGFAPGAPGDDGFTYGHQQTTNLTCNTGMTECTLDREPPLSVISKFKAIVNRARAAANASLLNHWSATAMDFSHNSLELLPALACRFNDRTLIPSRYVDDSRGVFPVKADLPPQPEPAVPPCSTAPSPSTSTAAASGNPVRPQNRSFSEWLSYLWNYGIRDESSPAGSTGPAITLDQSPGMSLLRDCYRVAEPLHQEVIRFIDDLKASGSPDDDWHKDDIIPMAVLWRKGATEAGEVPVNLFLDEVLHSPELGLDHESVRNIFAFDDQGELSIRGRHNVFPFDGQGKLRVLGRKAGGGLFYQSRQGGAQTGHARELARCMLRAMARQRLPQKMSGKSLDAGIFKRVRQLQVQQQQPPGERQEILAGLKALFRPPLSFPPTSAPVLNLLQAGLEKKDQEEEAVEAAKRTFLELSPGDQLEALEALLEQPDLYGLDCKYEWISAVQEALSSESVSPADSENAWYLLAYQFDIRHGVRREVAGKVKVMDLVRKVADPADEMVQRALAGLLFDRLPVSATIYEQSLPGNHPRSVALPFQYHDYDESLSVSLINDYEIIKSEIGRQIRESGNVKDTEEDDPLLEKQINELSVYCLQNYLEKQDKGHEPDISAIVMEELELDEKEIEDTAFVD